MLGTTLSENETTIIENRPRTSARNHLIENESGGFNDTPAHKQLEEKLRCPAQQWLTAQDCHFIWIKRIRDIDNVTGNVTFFGLFSGLSEV